MNKTSIEWCTHSLNCIRASREVRTLSGDTQEVRTGHYCEKISPGCKNCYASRLQKRFGMPEFPEQRNGNIQVFLDEKKLIEPLRMRKPARIFWNDMSDMFGDWVPDEWIDQHFAVMALTPQHTHLVLTKRAKRMREYCSARLNSMEIYRLVMGTHILRRMKGTVGESHRLPLPNVHLGVSVESQKYADERIPELLATPAAVRWVSAEPLLEAVDFTRLYGHITINGHQDLCVDALRGLYAAAWRARNSYPDRKLSDIGAGKLDWVVIGGESGPGARPFDLAWARSIIAQCKAAGAPVFMKQMGANPYIEIDSVTAAVGFNHSKGGNPEEWPSDLRVREYPA